MIYFVTLCLWHKSTKRNKTSNLQTGNQFSASREDGNGAGVFTFVKVQQQRTNQRRFGSIAFANYLQQKLAKGTDRLFEII